MTVGEKVGAYVKDQDIPQVDLAKKVHLTPVKLNLSLSGKRRLTFEEYESLCWALDVPVDKFLEPHPPFGNVARQPGT